MGDNKPQRTWVNYTVALALGVAFSIILLIITWNNSLETEKREFALLSSSIKDTVARNVQTANDTLNSLAAFLEARSDLSEQQYAVISSTLLELHPFIEGAVYSTRSYSETGPGDRFEIRYQTMRNSSVGRPESELLSDAAYTNAINDLFEKDTVITLDSDYAANGWKAYWILKAVNSRPEDNSDGRVVSGFVAILINTRKLIGQNIGDTELSVMLLSDSAGLSGRQFLFQKNASMESDWTVAQLAEEGITQFPLYSIKLAISKYVPWNELDKSMIYIALLIGAGVTLLLIAVVKTKDEQERQLRERNVVIEAKVYEQTEELAHARDQALQASLMKSSFLASMSHEIRTPLNAIIGMSDLLAETNLDFEQKKYVGVFKKAGDTLLSLVNDILDLSKIEANQLQLEKIELNLVDTIEESVEIYALKAAEKGVELICNVDPTIKPVRMGDPSRLRQILLNLISNALKFTEKGEIVISAINIRDEIVGTVDADFIEITVSDTGTGIPADKLELIFASFTQADSSTTRKFGGTGLGLTISRRLVEMMGGKIWVESTLGMGSRFIFRVEIPVATAHPENISNQQDKLTGMKIMLVDDNETSRNVLKSYIRYLGAEVVALADGVSALTCLENNATNVKYDLVLVDSDMSGMDGFSLVKKIRENNSAILIILILNPATLNQNQKYLAQLDNTQICLTRPVKKKELIHHLISNLSTEDRKKTLVTQVKDEKPIKSLRILLVDDNPDNRLLVNAYLKKLPYVLDEAENGEEAVHLFTRTSYDLVLMDVQMPVMDGREATRQIRQWEQQQDKKPVPIIALTAHAIKEEIEMCLEAGCTSHLSKPVKKSTLITTIQASTI